jgi:hypothetical protein
MQPIQKLRARGFVVIRGVVDERETNALRIIARRGRLAWAAEDPSSPSMHRDSARVPAEPAQWLTQVLEHYYRTFYPDIDQTTIEWNFLKSYGNAPDQSVHRNFLLTRSDQNPMDASVLPGSLLVATQDDTIVYGYGWNHQVAFESSKTVIQLRRGDILFYRGDFIHSRAGYSWKNLCVHTFLGSVYSPPQFYGQLVPLYADNPPVDMNDCACYVWGCQYTARTRRALSKHLSSRHHFVMQSPRARGLSNGSVGEAEVVDLTWPFDNGAMLVVSSNDRYDIRSSVGIIDFVQQENDMSTSSGDGQAPINVDDDMEMETLVANDSSSETETDSASPISEEDIVLVAIM